MRRTQAVLLTGCLVVAGVAGAGTASGEQPARSADRQRAVGAPLVPEPLPRPDPRMVEPDQRAPGSMPEVVPSEPGAVPMPEPHGPRSRAVPMPQLDQHDDELGLDLLLRGGSQPPGD